MGTLQAPSSAPLAGFRAKRLGREVAAAAAVSLLALGGLFGSLEPLAVVSSARAQAAERIVAAGGVVTEVLYALGQQDKVVGVDTTSQWPPEALKDKKSVGYVRALSAEGVLSLKPSQVIAVEGAGPPDALALLKESGTPITMIPEALTPEAVVSKIAAIGKAAGVAESAQQLAAAVKGRFEELDKLRSGLPGQKRVLFVLSLQNGRTLVGGRATTADAIIALAGGVNAASAVEGFKPMTDEAIITAAPDVVLMMRHTNSGAHSAVAAELYAMPAFSQTPAAKQQSLIRMDGLYLLGFGPRTPNAARDLMAELYPEAKVAQLSAAK
ncbi:heme/hemin ABC transporter substrate-binding protein [Bosea sp. (in: a-proteobacteria)]|uniref:heme/hemin ABC transporter substrate-binding protein n=1 Tax=Bosea sp. (in: a-proteobacteria) TaxID=1871050 RepID=UPI002DDD51C1|nr:ABC transporter substrate-binding protein [Bosea sp. (in: a-proteobacteria)]HEV2508526.1 ABC transporter substrate-binding protein [Bosea sp. (in: a-proteobacteria)]